MDTTTSSSRRGRGLTRRRFIAGTGVAAAAAATTTVATAGPAEAHSSVPRALPTPEPIPGGVEAIPGDPNSFIHWFIPGPEGATTPIIGIPAMGLDVEPTTMTNFHGVQAFAVLAGTAKGSDGKTYDCEFDVRVMEGRYRAADGVERKGAFAFLWVDLFVPGSGANGQLEQVVDMTPGTMPNDLFWTGQIPRASFHVDRRSRSARLRLTNYPLVETFQFGGSLAVHGQADITVRWKATGDPQKRGKGSSVEPTDPAAFEGEFRDATATGWVNGFRPGLDFSARRLDSSGYYASLGPMRNGSYLT